MKFHSCVCSLRNASAAAPCDTNPQSPRRIAALQPNHFLATLRSFPAFETFK
jgi:hypothetical protein